MKMRITTLLIILIYLSSAYTVDAQRPKIGLVLSGGGAKGIAHIGTLKMLDTLKIPVDYVVGTSMGGILGALYAVGYRGTEIENIARNVDWNELFTDRPKREKVPYLRKKYDGQHQLVFDLKGFTPVIPNALVDGQKVALLFSRLTRNYASVKDFNNLPKSFRCVAVDLVTGNEVVLSHGSLSRAMRSTMSIPTVFKPVSWGDSLLIDGGIINNFPADVMSEMNPDFIIGVDVGAPLLKKEEISSVLDVFQQTFNLFGNERNINNWNLANILVAPDVKNFSPADFDPENVNQLLIKGEIAARENLDAFIDLKQRITLYNNDAKDQIRLDKTDSSAIIYRLEIKGNEQLSFNFIYDQIGLKPGDVFSVTELENRITNLFALGYFETIDYDISYLDTQHIILSINVVERSKRELRIGLRYDDFYYLVGLTSFVGTDVLIPGLRLESDLQFAGLTSFQIKFSLPSRNLDVPVFPFIRYYFWDSPVAIYDVMGEQIAAYKDKGQLLGLGLNILLGKSWIAEAEYLAEYMNIKPDVALRDSTLFPKFEDHLRTFRLSSTYDRLDNVILPREGLWIYGRYDRSRKGFGSDLTFDRLEISARWYFTLHNRHTVMLYGFYGYGKNMPIYKYFYLGGPDTFVGLDYMQLIADRINVVRLDYRYEFKKDIFIKLIGNAAFNYSAEGNSPPAGNSIILGYAAGIQFQSIVGPLEFMYALGDQSPLHPGPKQYNFYFKAGYIF